MPDMDQRTRRDTLRAELERLVKLDEMRAAPAVHRAIQSLLTALDYRDATLIGSHANTLVEAIRDFMADQVKGVLGRPKLFKEAWRKIWEEHLKGQPFENLDDLGKAFESLINKAQVDLVDLRDGPLRILQDLGFAIDNRDEIDRDIEDLRKLKADVLQDWPWSDRVLPPVNRRMVEESRAAVARGEKGDSIKDLIRRLDDTPANGG
jgi:hypothetical protein